MMCLHSDYSFGIFKLFLYLVHINGGIFIKIFNIACRIRINKMVVESSDTIVTPLLNENRFVEGYLQGRIQDFKLGGGGRT